MKTCTTCGMTKPFDAYYRREGGRLRSYCKLCATRLTRARRANNPSDQRKKKIYNSVQYRNNRKLILAGNPRCALCGEPGADSADHIIPISRGGTTALENLQPAHFKCNSARSDRMVIRYTAAW